MSGSRWQSFTAKEKLEITAAAEEIGNRAAARRHDVDESCIRDWRKKKASLESAHKEKRAFCGPKTDDCVFESGDEASDGSSDSGESAMIEGTGIGAVNVAAIASK
ncbi:hypothetical protein HPB52_010241 [Rhipicephalus sanguineus]|uniref:Brinker DNA-binding domain-containing protein n=1 Tax=Rhipicephalus sanguineus TaxID=34632 RepID=A0A9D4T9B9_RHISA|nr:hypothetical protein HPB52_010241 [Rhipicephalus sanguineus]